MSVNLSDITCPVGCTSQLPAVDASVCDPDINYGEVDSVFFTNIGYPLTNFEDLSEWNSRLSNTSADNNAIRQLHVSGELPPPEKTIVDGTLCRKYHLGGDYALSFEMDETGDNNYRLLMETKCYQEYLLWFTCGKYIYGGNAGITGRIILDDNLSRGCKELNMFQGMLEWFYKFPPDRGNNPFANLP